MAREIPIRGDMIRLGQLLKLADVVDGGGEVKDFLAEVDVTVNGEPEDRRGRQLHPGAVVVPGDGGLRVVGEGGAALLRPCPGRPRRRQAARSSRWRWPPTRRASPSTCSSR